MEVVLLGQSKKPDCLTKEEWENFLFCQPVMATPVSFTRVSEKIWRYRSPHEAVFRFGTFEELAEWAEKANPVPQRFVAPERPAQQEAIDISSILDGI